MVDIAEGEFTSLFGDRSGREASGPLLDFGLGNNFDRSNLAGLLLRFSFLLLVSYGSDVGKSGLSWTIGACPFRRARSRTAEAEVCWETARGEL